MRRHYLVLSLMLVIFLCYGAPALSMEQEGLLLFTEEEAKTLRLTEDEWNRMPPMRSISFGPGILIQHPKVTELAVGPTIEVPIPVDLIVVFEEKKAPVDMDSLKIKIKKGMFSKSLTNRLRPYIQGNTLRGEKLEFPAGRYSVEFSITDIDGSRTVETYLLLVRKSEDDQA